jgi:aspartate/methionine/tyrosine aminotransferase
MTHDRKSRFELAQWVVPLASKARYNLGTSEVHGRKAGDFMPDPALKVNSGIFDGDPELKEILANRYGTTVDNVALTAGASEANFLVSFALLRDGGSVLVESPVYAPLVGIQDLLGARIKRWERSFEHDYRLDLESLKSLVKDDVRLIVITNLHNPTGAMISPDDLKATAEIASDAGAQVLCDEIYREFVADRTIPVFECGDNCITSASVSKVHGFGGLRLGWTVASEQMTKKILEVREMASVCCSRMDEEMGKGILSNRRILEEARALAARNMSIVKDWVQHTERVSWVEPGGGIVCFPRLEGIQDSRAFARYLFDEHGTLVSPGYFFGAEGHIRIGCGCDQDTLKGGLEAIATALPAFNG